MWNDPTQLPFRVYHEICSPFFPLGVIQAVFLVLGQGGLGAARERGRWVRGAACLTGPGKSLTEIALPFRLIPQPDRTSFHITERSSEPHASPALPSRTTVPPTTIDSSPLQIARFCYESPIYEQILEH